MGHPGEAFGADDGMVDLLPEVSGVHLLVQVDVVGGDDRLRIDADRVQRGQGVLLALAGEPRGELAVDVRGPVRTSGGGVEARVECPDRRSDQPAQCLPLPVTADPQGDPLVRVGAGVDPLVAESSEAIPLPGHQVAVDGLFQHLLGDQLGGEVDHGQLDQLSLAGPSPVLEGAQDGEGGMHPGQGVADPRNDREPVGVAGDPGQTGHLFHRRHEPGALPPGALQAEAGHAHHDELGIDRGQALEVQPEVLHHPGCEVLDHDV